MKKNQTLQARLRTALGLELTHNRTMTARQHPVWDYGTAPVNTRVR